ncbi:hypothetical protein HanRHA438_Chr12g0573651 [Helianthus annuus]|nr:hypothetical protein HanRHA438_Chr12g0573651 [Helianthus annuus]
MIRNQIDASPTITVSQSFATVLHPKSLAGLNLEGYGGMMKSLTFIERDEIRDVVTNLKGGGCCSIGCCGGGGLMVMLAVV